MITVHESFLPTMFTLLSAIVSCVEDLKRKFAERCIESFVDRLRFLCLSIAVHSLPLSLSERVGILVILDILTNRTNCAQELKTHCTTIQPLSISSTNHGSPCVPAATSICQPFGRESDRLFPISSGEFDLQRGRSHHNNSLPDLNSLLMKPMLNQHKHFRGFDGCCDGFCVWDLQMNVAYYSPRWYAALGHNGSNLSSILPRTNSNENISNTLNSLQRYVEGSSSDFSCEHQLQHEGGSYRNMLIRGSMTQWGVLFVMNDVTRYISEQERLKREAYFDHLTQLQNGKALRENLEQILKQSRRKRDNSFAVLFLDLNDFKPINDKLGHVAGDIVLQRCAKRIAGEVRPGDSAFRNGGDEFVVLLTEVAGKDEVDRVTERIKEAIRQPIFIDADKTVFTSVSVGYFIADGSEQLSVDDIIHKADKAMYADKGSSKERQLNFVTRLNRDSNDCKEMKYGVYR